MKMTSGMLGAAALALSVGSAQALTFDWHFNTAGGPVSGTLFGLSQGMNESFGLTLTQAPNGNYSGNTFTYSSIPYVTVSPANQITEAQLGFSDTHSDLIYLQTGAPSSNGFYNFNSSPDFYFQGTSDPVFSLRSQPSDVPLPASVGLLASAIGLAFMIGWRNRRRGIT